MQAVEDLVLGVEDESVVVLLGASGRPAVWAFSSDRKPISCGSPLLVEAGDGVHQLLVLAVDRLLLALQVGLRPREPGLGALQLATDLAELVPGRLHLGARDLEVVARGAQLGPDRDSAAYGTPGPLARLVEVGLGVLHGVLGLRLLVAKVLDVGVGERGRAPPTPRGGHRDGDDQALACGGGEESHRMSLRGRGSGHSGR